jgi:hypothetical protein
VRRWSSILPHPIFVAFCNLSAIWTALIVVWQASIVLFLDREGFRFWGCQLVVHHRHE